LLSKLNEEILTLSGDQNNQYSNINTAFEAYIYDVSSIYEVLSLMKSGFHPEISNSIESRITNFQNRKNRYIEALQYPRR